MRHICYFLVTLSITCVPLENVYAQSNFQKAYSTPNNDDGWYVKQYGSGYFIAGNSTGAGSGGYNAVVMYLNLLGDTVWTRHIGTQYHDFFIDAAICVSSPDIYVVTEEANGFTLENNMRVTRITSTGNIVWSQVFPSWAEKHARAICATYNGGFAITGSADSTVGDSSGIFAMRCDGTGNPLWFKKYTGALLTGSGTDICQTAGGGFLIAGRITNPNLSNSRVIALSTDALGTIMWTRMIDLAANVDEPCIDEQQSGDILLSGFAYGTSGSGYVFVAGMTFSGNITWFKKYVPVTDEHYQMKDAFLYTSTASLTMVGQHEAPNLHSGYVLRVSSTGVVQVSNIYNSNNHDTHLNGIDVTSDGGIAAIGFTDGVSTPNDSGGIVLIKSALYTNSVCGQTAMTITTSNVTYTMPFASSFGVAGSWSPWTDTVVVQYGLEVYNGCFVSIEELKEQQITISPNPGTDIFAIVYDAQPEDEIVVLNCMGDEVRRSQLTSSVSLENSPSGIYFVQIFREGEIILQSKLIKSD